MRVLIPSPLQSYTCNQGQVEATGVKLYDLLCNLDSQYPGIKFRMIDEQDRIRQHIKLFVDGQQASDLNCVLKPASEVHIICALSGG
jgi:molybdopterin converting factor small subunit